MTFKVIAYDNRVTRITFEKPSLSREEVMFNDYDAAKRFVNSLKDDWVYRSYRFRIVYRKISQHRIALLFVFPLHFARIKF